MHHSTAAELAESAGRFADARAVPGLCGQGVFNFFKRGGCFVLFVFCSAMGLALLDGGQGPSRSPGTSRWVVVVVVVVLVVVVVVVIVVVVVVIVVVGFSFTLESYHTPPPRLPGGKFVALARGHLRDSVAQGRLWQTPSSCRRTADACGYAAAFYII